MTSAYPLFMITRPIFSRSHHRHRDDKIQQTPINLAPRKSWDFPPLTPGLPSLLTGEPFNRRLGQPELRILSASALSCRVPNPMVLAKADNIRRFRIIPALKPKPGGVKCMGARQNQKNDYQIYRNHTVPAKFRLQQTQSIRT